MRDFLEAYQKLNVNQKKAVDALAGPVMVIAGPGTGKTEVLTLRIVNLIRQKKAKPEQILALTFTDSAANSMRKRISGFLGAIAYDISITTFHGFCNSVILENPELFIFAKDLKKADELDKNKIIKAIIKKKSFLKLKPFYSPFYYQKDIIKAISDLKRAGLEPDDFKAKIDSIKRELEKKQEINSKTGKLKTEWKREWEKWKKLLDLALIYQKYQELCQKKGLYDFDDMIVWVAKKLKNNTLLREDYRAQFKYFLSDEYQDTNIVQNAVLKILAGKKDKAEIFTVGDDDQAIYGFQGANLENILSFAQEYPSAKIIPISVNYRSGEEIVALAEALIQNNQERITERLKGKVNKNITSKAGKIGKQSVENYEFLDALSEDYFLVEKTKELIESGIPASEIAVLVKTNAQVSRLANIFIKGGIPVEITDASSVLEKTATKELISILEAVSDPVSDVAVYRAMSLSFWGINEIDFFNFTLGARRLKKTLADYFLFLLENADQKKWQNFGALKDFFSRIFDLQKEAVNGLAIGVMEKTLNRSGLLAFYLNKKDVRSLNQLHTLFNFTKAFQEKNPVAGLKKLLDDLKIMNEDGIKIKEKKLSMAEEDVRIMTVHQSKGKEFEAVFIPNLDSGNWGGRINRENLPLPFEKLLGLESRHFEFNKEESERRLFFVALTRAKKRLILSRASFPSTEDTEKEKTPSRFLEEIKTAPIATGDISYYEGNLEKKAALVLGASDQKEESVFSRSEKKFLKKRVEDLTLSPTGLNLFLKCPRCYKYEKLLLVPKLKSKSLILGTAVHQGLEDFYRLFRDQGKIDQTVLLVGFNASLAKEVLKKEERESVKEEGEKILQTYFDYYKNSLEKPLKLETSFGKVFLEGVLLTGKVDKIEAIGGTEVGEKAGKSLVRVIDYKTGRRYTKNAILGKTKNGNEGIYRQLVFYKLLSLLDNKFPFLVGEVQVDFVKPEGGKFHQESFVIEEEEIEVLKKTITEVIERIKRLDFAKTKNKRECTFCEHRDFCENQ